MGQIRQNVTLLLALNAFLEKHSSLLGPFISYEENEVLWKQAQGLYLQHIIFFMTYK
jgi:hypothetical protein